MDTGANTVRQHINFLKVGHEYSGEIYIYIYKLINFTYIYNFKSYKNCFITKFFFFDAAIKILFVFK